MLAIDILRWPGVNQAFLFSFVFTTLLSVVVVPIGKRRKFDRKATWGEAMLGAAYVFAVLFWHSVLCLTSSLTTLIKTWVGARTNLSMARLTF